MRQSMAKISNVSKQIVALLLVIATTSAGAQSIDKQSLRDDAFRLMGAGAWVPGVAAYCNKYVASNPRLIAAAKKWNEKHSGFLTKVIRVIEWSGGMTAEERKYIDQFAFGLLRQQLEEQSDKAQYCESVVNFLNQGGFDLDKADITAAAFKRIMEVSVP